MIYIIHYAAYVDINRLIKFISSDTNTVIVLDDCYDVYNILAKYSNHINIPAHKNLITRTCELMSIRDQAAIKSCDSVYPYMDISQISNICYTVDQLNPNTNTVLAINCNIVHKAKGFVGNKSQLQLIYIYQDNIGLSYIKHLYAINDIVMGQSKYQLRWELRDFLDFINKQYSYEEAYIKGTYHHIVAEHDILNYSINNDLCEIFDYKYIDKKTQLVEEMYIDEHFSNYKTFGKDLDHIKKTIDRYYDTRSKLFQRNFDIIANQNEKHK